MLSMLISVSWKLTFERQSVSTQSKPRLKRGYYLRKENDPHAEHFLSVKNSIYENRKSL